MNRTVPRATSDEIQLYRSTLYSLLRSTAEVKIRTLVGVHEGMNSLMHPLAREATPDISAFIYSAMRLPDCIPHIRLVLLGQNSAVLSRNGFPSVESWQSVSARARRRRCYYDGKDTLACYIASRSDIEDAIPTLTAYQIEWNKMHVLLSQWPKDIDISLAGHDKKIIHSLADVLKIDFDDIERLQSIWREDFFQTIQLIQQKELSFSVRLLGGSLVQYMRATHEWFENIKTAFPDITNRPVYFISSNTHSIANVLTGFALKHETELDNFIQSSQDEDIRSEWEHIKTGIAKASKANFLYYVLKKYQNTQAGSKLIQMQSEDEYAHGIIHINPSNTFNRHFREH